MTTKVALVGGKNIVAAAIALLLEIGVRNGRSGSEDAGQDIAGVKDGSKAMFVQFDRMHWIAIEKRDYNDPNLDVFDLDTQWAQFVQKIPTYQKNALEIKAANAINGEIEKDMFVKCINFGRKKKPDNIAGTFYKADRMFMVRNVENTRIKGIQRVHAAYPDGTVPLKAYVHSNWLVPATVPEIAKYLTNFVKTKILREGSVVETTESEDKIIVRAVGTDIWPVDASITDLFMDGIPSLNNLMIRTDDGDYPLGHLDIIDADPIVVDGHTVTFDSGRREINIGCISIPYGQFLTLVAYREHITPALISTIKDRAEQLGVDI